MNPPQVYMCIKKKKEQQSWERGSQKAQLSKVIALKPDRKFSQAFIIYRSRHMEMD